MHNESSSWTGSNIILFVKGVSAISVLLGLLAIFYSMLSPGAGPAVNRWSLLPMRVWPSFCSVFHWEF